MNAPNVRGYSACSLLHVTSLAPRILTYLRNSWKVSELLMKTVVIYWSVDVAPIFTFMCQLHSNIPENYRETSKQGITVRPPLRKHSQWWHSCHIDRCSSEWLSVVKNDFSLHIFGVHENEIFSSSHWRLAVGLFQPPQTTKFILFFSRSKCSVKFVTVLKRMYWS